MSYRVAHDLQIPHVIEAFGDWTTLHIVTDLPLTPSAPGFDADARYELAQRVGKLLGPNNYLIAEFHHKPQQTQCADARSGRYERDLAS